MTDVPKDVEAIARQCWDMAQRVGMQIAAKPPEEREAAFLAAEPALHELAQGLGVQKSELNKFVRLQIQVMRDIVLKLDVSGKPQGGKA